MSESQSRSTRSTRSAKRKTSPSAGTDAKDASSPSPAKKARTVNPSPREEAASGGSDTDPPSPTSITPDTFRRYLQRYPICVPEKLQELDEARYETIPAAVRSRSRAQAGAGKGGASEKSEEDDGAHGYLTKDEVVKLVEWKLKHGTFRPALLGMARAHPPDLIRSTTARAYTQLLSPSPDSSLGAGGATAAMKTLCTLRGIGPATASLLLSCADAETVPFFSDELYRWMMWDVKDTKGSRWTRKIGYTDKEYKALREAVGRVREKMKGEERGEVGAVELEKVAYVLGREP